MANVTMEVSLLAGSPVQAGSVNRTSICLITANSSLLALELLVQIPLVCVLSLPNSYHQALLVRGQAQVGDRNTLSRYTQQPLASCHHRKASLS